MQRYIPVLILVLLMQKLVAQTAEALEAQARRTENPRDRMVLLYRAAEKNLTANPAKASNLAHQAYSLALDNNDVNAAARAAFLNAEGYARQQKWSDAKFRYNRSRESAMQGKDVDFAVKALGKMADMARREGDKAEADLFTQQAQELKSGSRVAINNTTRSYVTEGVRNNYVAPPSPALTKPTPNNQAEMNAMREQFRLQTEQLERERQRLLAEINAIRQEKEAMNKGMVQLRDKEKVLSEQTEMDKMTIANREEQLELIAKEKEAINKLAKRKQKLLDAMRNEKLLDSIAYAQEKQEREFKLQKANNMRNLLILGLGSTLIVMFLMYRRFKENQKQQKILIEKNKIIEEERQRSDELLLNILPATVAKELKSEGKAKASRHDSVSVLFTDFKGFTNIAEQLTPEQLVRELDTYFKAFDFIVGQYKLEKIKTIGDAYMCADGLNGKRSNPMTVVKAALDMQEFINEMKAEKIRKGEPFFEARIGINTGPVVAGVVGVKKFAYDIWGDTVNIAARIQENCDAGMVNISETTFNEVKYNFICRYRGRLPAKNKGDIDMYYVDKTMN